MIEVNYDELTAKRVDFPGMCCFDSNQWQLRQQRGGGAVPKTAYLIQGRSRNLLYQYCADRVQ
jgi:hypothetical protein